MTEETETPKPDAVAGRLDGLVMPGSSWTRNSYMYPTTVLAVDEHYVYFTAPWTKRGEARKMIDAFLAHYSKA